MNRLRASIGPAYLNQTINLVVGILLVPVLLHFLDASHYLLWVIFTTFGGITLQIESSIQVVSVREIAKEFHNSNDPGIRRAIARARRTYCFLASGVMIPIMVGGALYLSFVVEQKVSQNWMFPWLLFSATYAINYFFGANNCILLALSKVETFNYIGSATRAINFLATLGLLIAGYSIIGICMSFALSVVLGCIASASVARRTLGEIHVKKSADARIGGDSETTNLSSLGKYTLFTFCAYFLYKGGLLIATSLFPKSVVAPYSLTLQAFTMLTAVSLVPIQVGLAALVKSIVLDDSSAVVREMGRIFLYSNLVFVAGTLFITLFGNALLGYIGAKISFPGGADILAVSFAFLIELNLFVLINYVVTKREYGFVLVYVPSAMTAMLCGLLTAKISQNLILSLVIVPACIQAAICLPLLVKRVSSEMRTTPSEFSRLMFRAMLARS